MVGGNLDRDENISFFSFLIQIFIKLSFEKNIMFLLDFIINLLSPEKNYLQYIPKINMGTRFENKTEHNKQIAEKYRIYLYFYT